jgi:hypothetical protein
MLTKPGQALPSLTASRHDLRVHLVQRRQAVEAVVQHGRHVVQGAQRAGHDDEPAVVAQQRGEGAQHAGGAEVVDLGVGADDGAGVVVGADSHDGVAERRPPPTRPSSTMPTLHWHMLMPQSTATSRATDLVMTSTACLLPT